MITRGTAACTVVQVTQPYCATSACCSYAQRTPCRMVVQAGFEEATSTASKRMGSMEDRLMKLEALVAVLPTWKEDLVGRLGRHSMGRAWGVCWWDKGWLEQ